MLGRPCVRPIGHWKTLQSREQFRSIVLCNTPVSKRWIMGFLNVYSHWLSPPSFALALQVTTTILTLVPSFRRFSRRYSHVRSHHNFTGDILITMVTSYTPAWEMIMQARTSYQSSLTAGFCQRVYKLASNVILAQLQTFAELKDQITIAISTSLRQSLFCSMITLQSKGS